MQLSVQIKKGNFQQTNKKKNLFQLTQSISPVSLQIQPGFCLLVWLVCEKFTSFCETAERCVTEKSDPGVNGDWRKWPEAADAGGWINVKKGINDLTSSITSLLHISPPSRTLRSSSSIHLTVPSTLLTTMGSRAFSCSTPQHQNSLPLDIRNIDSLRFFKSRLKSHHWHIQFNLFFIWPAYSLFYVNFTDPFNKLVVFISSFNPTLYSCIIIIIIIIIIIT